MGRSSAMRKVLFIGRIAVDTGYQTCVNWCKKNNYELIVNDKSKLSEVDLIFAGGYMVALEAWSIGKPILVTWDNVLKRDYWQMHPMYNATLSQARNWAKTQTWEKLANIYENLWRK